ncbi:MAG: hypothetical protein CMI26_00355 [Opitutae bacterium]|nr:hypothetical protein [Opitutae bacterium]|tara:strand:+ start:6419 stop:7684 length:1266 start_codon:yes stop_codon:yes gene_type:complete
MKADSQGRLAIIILAAMVTGCERRTESPLNSLVLKNGQNPSDTSEANATGHSDSNTTTLSKVEQRKALDGILTHLDKAKERAGLNEEKLPTFGSVNYANGGKYVGGFKNGKRHGLGSFIFANGDRFQGHYTEGKREGYGTYEFTSGERYEGYFHNGKYHHWGLYFFKNGDKYFGQYRHGTRNGTGTLSKKNGERYEGDFYEGKRQGFGSCVFEDGSRYSGTWKNNEPEGWGTYVIAPSSTTGESSKKFQTKGKEAQTSTDPSVESLAGEFHEQINPIPSRRDSSDLASMDSLGIDDIKTSRSSNETNFPQSMENKSGSLQGESTDGFLDFENGDRYAGQMLKGLPHGQGAFLFSNGDRYLGDFRKGAYNGQGLFAFSDGSRYLGKWKNGLFHGGGILYGRNGKIKLEGEWINGLLNGKTKP